MTVVDVVPAGVPVPTRSKGVIAPMAKEDNPNVYKKEDDSEIAALFNESNLLQTVGDVYPPPQVDRQGCISNPSHSYEFFTLLTDVRRRFIREYWQRTNAQPYVPPVAEIGRVLPRSVMGSTADAAPKVDVPGRPKRKNLKQNLVEKGGKAVTTSKIAKAAKGSSKRRKKNPASDSEINVEGVRVIPLAELSMPIGVITDMTSNLAEIETPQMIPVADTSCQTPVERQDAGQEFKVKPNVTEVNVVNESLNEAAPLEVECELPP